MYKNSYYSRKYLKNFCDVQKVVQSLKFPYLHAPSLFTMEPLELSNTKNSCFGPLMDLKRLTFAGNPHTPIYK